MRPLILDSIRSNLEAVQGLSEDAELVARIEEAAERAVACLKAGGKILFAGNGGSAADAQHLSAELVSRFNFDRPGLPAIALTTDTSALLAIGNDYGFERVFARQVEALGRKGDLLVAISTSGNSPNILKALETAQAQGLIRIGFSGRDGGKMHAYCDINLVMPSSETPRIQECHILVGHILCDIIERCLFGPDA